MCSTGCVVSHFMDSEGESNTFDARLHCVTFQKTVIYITLSMRTLNLACYADSIGYHYITHYSLYLLWLMPSPFILLNWKFMLVHNLKTHTKFQKIPSVLQQNQRWG